MQVPNGPRRDRRSPGTITTKSGKTLKVHRSISDRAKSRKLAQAASKAEYLSTLPKDRLKRTLYRLHPKRVARYWFSREGGIMALKIVGVSIIAAFFLTIGLFAYFRKDLPKIKDIAGTSLPGSNTYYDRTNKIQLWEDYDAVKRTPVEGDQISPYIKQATIAIEDKDFYKHGAFDVRGIARAAVKDVTGGGGALQGGSTLTQQLVKLNAQWTENRTVTRKVKELILAVELEREYSKDDILTGYLNIAPYSGVDSGVEAAAQSYFHVTAKDLSLAQSTMLAAIPQSPTYYSPYGSTKYNSEAGNSFNQEALIGRQHYILDQMVKQGYIKKAQADEAKGVDVLAQVQQRKGLYDDIKAPYFVIAAKKELEQKYGGTTVNRGGWRIVTTLDMNLQTAAEKVVADNYANIQRRTAGLADTEATVAEDVQTGQIAALVGGVDFNNKDYGKLNFADSRLISPGSTFKPYDYVTFINNNNNVGASSVLYDNDTVLPNYQCTVKASGSNAGNCLKDYDFLQPGPITLRYALGGSRNVPAVKAMLSAVPNDTSKLKVDSVNKTINTASAMMANTYMQSKNKSAYRCFAPGTEDIDNAPASAETQCYEASAIGDGAYLYLDDHVNGFATLARMGNAIPRTFIMKVTDASGKTLYEWKQPAAKQVIKADAAYIVNNMAADPRASYLPGSCTDTTCTPLSSGGYKFHRYNGWQFAVKTGTTNFGFDGLMASWSNKYAVVSWVGNHTRNVDITSKTRTSMEYLTEPITRGVMEAAHAGLKPDNWVQPTTVKTAAAFVQRNHIHFGDIVPGPTNDLYPGYYVGGSTVKNGSSETTDKISGKVATSCTPAAAKQTVTNGNAAFWNVDIFNGGKANLNSGTSASSTPSTPSPQDDVHNCNDAPPTVSLTAPNTCDTSCTITATVSQGTHALSDPARANFPGTITFTLNGQNIHSENVSDSPSTVSFTYTPTSTGSGNLTATVSDSVLYQGTDSTTLNFTMPAAVSTAFTLTGKTSGQTTKFSWWDSATGPYTVYNADTNAPLCNTADTTCSVAVALAPANSRAYVRDSTGKQSGVATVK